MEVILPASLSEVTKYASAAPAEITQLQNRITELEQQLSVRDKQLEEADQRFQELGPMDIETADTERASTTIIKEQAQSILPEPLVSLMAKQMGRQ